VRLTLIGASLASGAGAIVLVAVHGSIGLEELLVLFVGWSFVASGIVAWTRRPENHVGALMLAVGLMWFGALLLKSWHASIPLTAGIWIGDIWLLPLVFLLAGFPTMRLDGRLDRVLLAALTFIAIPVELLWLMFFDFQTNEQLKGAPDNALLIAARPDVAHAIDVTQRVILLGALGTLTVTLARRYRRAGGPLRRALAPVLAGSIGLGAFTAVYAVDTFGGDVELLYAVALLVLTAVPLVFLVGLLRARLARSSIGDLLVDLREPAPPGALRDALAKALRDPSLQLAYWVPEYESYVATDGEPVTLGEGATLVERNGVHVAALIHDPSLKDEPELVGAVASAAGIALENERLQADLRARLSDLRASRARIVEAGDSARRKLERDLHDGAQQRLVSLAVVLRVVENQLDPESPQAQLLGRARDELNASLEELRNIARGIHPAILTDHGLEVALESLATRSPVRVTLDVQLGARPPGPVEVAAYYLIAEGLTNVAKYAQATSAGVHVQRMENTLIVEVTDDGTGGADPAKGSGLRGLADRVEALDGRLKVWSPPAGGTRLRAEIPCA
jgi:signal transduction histidine kinase